MGDTFVLDGTFISARMTDDVARLVLHADPQQALPFVTPAVPGDEATARAQQMNREVVEQASAEDLLPHWRRLAADGSVAEEGTLVDCAAAHAPNTFSGFGMVTVVSVDLSEGLRAGIAASNAAGVMAGGQIVYASPEHLYVAAPEWVDYSEMPAPDAVVAAKQHGTDIHRFDISDPRAAKYEMSGHVEGDLVDQFAMDEHDGNLRVATTTGAPWDGGASESESQVVVLAPKGDTLTTIGHVGGLGRGETIQSVRFLGSVGYVVTFRQTDPLYTIDVSDPTNPHVAGELKILGFSAYLHPVGDGKLLGIGQDATESGGQLGTQVALFDVSDPANPTRVAQATVPNATSGAEWDHHAFLWWSASGLAAIPVERVRTAAVRRPRRIHRRHRSQHDHRARTRHASRRTTRRDPEREADAGRARHRRRGCRDGRRRRRRRRVAAVVVPVADPAFLRDRRSVVDALDRGTRGERSRDVGPDELRGVLTRQSAVKGRQG